MVKNLVLVFALAGVPCAAVSCEGETAQDVGLQRYSQQEALQQSIDAAVKAAVVTLPAGAAGPVGWATYGMTVIGTGVAAYFAARRAGSKKSPQTPAEAPKP